MIGPLASTTLAALAAVFAADAPLDLGLPPPRQPPAAKGGCPADARVELNLPAWKAALERADTPARRDDLLAQVKLALETPEPETSPAREPRLVLAGLEDAVVPLEADGGADHVLHVRYRVDGAEDAPTIHLVQVLRPLGGRASCALGDDLSRRDEPAGRLITYTLAFVPLLHARSKVIEVESVVGAARRSETRRAYYVVRGWKLSKIFDEATGRMDSSQTSVTTTTVGTLAVTGDFPKRIDLTEVTKRGGCEVRAGDTPCEDGGPGTKTTFVFDGTRYVRAKARR